MTQNQPEEFTRFDDLMKKLVKVPYQEVKAKLDEEKQAKKRKKAANRTSSASHDSDASL